MKMNIPMMIAAVERLVRMESAMVAKHQMAIAEIYASLPTDRSESFMWLIRQVAEARVERDRLEREEDAATAAVKIAEEAAKGSAWKWGARKDDVSAVPKDVAAAHAALKGVQEKLAPLNKRVAPLVALLKEEMKVEEEDEESAAWAARGYTDPMPAHIQRAEAERRRELEAECVTLKIPTSHAEWKEWIASRPKEEPEPEPEMWDPSECIVTRILAGDYGAYDPKPVETVVPVEIKAVRYQPKKVSSGEWLQRVVAAKKARRLALPLA
jgi:hypothetical protein